MSMSPLVSNSGPINSKSQYIQEEEPSITIKTTGPQAAPYGTGSFLPFASGDRVVQASARALVAMNSSNTIVGGGVSNGDDQVEVQEECHLNKSAVVVYHKDSSHDSSPDSVQKVSEIVKSQRAMVPVEAQYHHESESLVASPKDCHFMEGDFVRVCDALQDEEVSCLISDQGVLFEGNRNIGMHRWQYVDERALNPVLSLRTPGILLPPLDFSGRQGVRRLISSVYQETRDILVERSLKSLSLEEVIAKLKYVGAFAGNALKLSKSHLSLKFTESFQVHIDNVLKKLSDCLIGHAQRLADSSNVIIKSLNWQDFKQINEANTALLELLQFTKDLDLIKANYTAMGEQIDHQKKYISHKIEAMFAEIIIRTYYSAEDILESEKEQETTEGGENLEFLLGLFNGFHMQVIEVFNFENEQDLLNVLNVSKVQVAAHLESSNSVEEDLEEFSQMNKEHLSLLMELDSSIDGSLLVSKAKVRQVLAETFKTIVFEIGSKKFNEQWGQRFNRIYLEGIKEFCLPLVRHFGPVEHYDESLFQHIIRGLERKLRAPLEDTIER